MPSDQLLKCFTITTLSLLDEQFLVFRFVYSLCGPFQYSFHGLRVFGRPQNQKVVAADYANFAKLIGGFCGIDGCTNNKPCPNGKASGA